MKLFAIRDVKSEAYCPPMAITTVGLAVRGFSDECLNPKSDLSRYPADYMLYEIGTYDPNTAVITSLPVPVFVASATEMIAKAKQVRLQNEPLLPSVQIDAPSEIR